MNNCGTGAEKVCRFVSTRLPRRTSRLAMTKFFDCARNKKLIQGVLIHGMCLFGVSVRKANA